MCPPRPPCIACPVSTPHPDWGKSAELCLFVPRVPVTLPATGRLTALIGASPGNPSLFGTLEQRSFGVPLSLTGQSYREKVSSGKVMRLCCWIYPRVLWNRHI